MKIVILRAHPDRPRGACDGCLKIVGEENLCNGDLCEDCCHGSCSVCIVRTIREERIP